jgi:hypothetical protein
VRESLKDAYKTLSDYDRHYSTVRSALATFLFSLSYGSVAVLFKDAVQALSGDQVLLPIVLLLPLVFLSAAFLLSCYLQRLTYTCRIYMEGIEKLPPGSSTQPDPATAAADDDLNRVRTNLDLLITPQARLKDDERVRKTALLERFGKGEKDAPRFFGWDAPNVMLSVAFILLLVGYLVFFLSLPK